MNVSKIDDIVIIDDYNMIRKPFVRYSLNQELFFVFNLNVDGTYLYKYLVWTFLTTVEWKFSDETCKSKEVYNPLKTSEIRNLIMA